MHEGFGLRLLCAFFFLFSSCLGGDTAQLRKDVRINPPLAVTTTNDSLIRPGASIGPLRLGDRRDRALRVFPFKSGVDEESDTEKCGSEYLWVDSENEKKGNVFIRFQGSRVFQIEAATTRFHTGEGIRPLDSPTQVQRYYRGLRAYALRRNSPLALGGGPLIFWVDWDRGVAFTFATGRRDQKRYLYSIIVFRPGSKFCPYGESIHSPDWRELKPYSLDPADDVGENSGGRTPRN